MPTTQPGQAGSLSPSVESRELAQREYLLSSHVYLSASPLGVVLLDLRKDKYLGLSASAACLIAGLVDGWPDEFAAERDRSRELERLALVDELERDGILTRDPARGKSARPVNVSRSDRMTSVGFDGPTAARMRTSYGPAFIYACACAAWSLRFRSLEAVVNRVRARKGAADATTEFDEDRVRELVVAFRQLRQFAFTSRNNCLFNSLALLNFLACFGVFPTWIIGVEADPFAAHSWVQQGDLVLDATPELVNYFTPILAV